MQASRRAVAAPQPSAIDDELAQFVDEHYPRLIRLAVLLCQRGSDAEDAVQAALERAWRSRRSLADSSRLRPWLDRIVVREAARLVRSRRNVVELHLVTEAHRGQGPDETAAVRIALARLSVPQRTAVVLHLHAGYSINDTAVILGVPEGTVRSRVRIARQYLREQLVARGE
jgi:RNA polymerase sigma-70 factor (ECF subfamily)